MIKLYGIPNCDSVKKAMVFFKENNIPFAFHDFKKQGLSADKISTWLALQPSSILLNKKSTTWKLLSADEQALALTTKGTKILLQQYTNLVKRPVVEHNNSIVVGYSENIYSEIFL